MSEAQPALLQGAVAAHPAACLPLLWLGLLDRVHSEWQWLLFVWQATPFAVRLLWLH